MTPHVLVNRSSQFHGVASISAISSATGKSFFLTLVRNRIVLFVFTADNGAFLLTSSASSSSSSLGNHHHEAEEDYSRTVQTLPAEVHVLEGWY
jgi:hypothetical protein